MNLNDLTTVLAVITTEHPTFDAGPDRIKLWMEIFGELDVADVLEATVDALAAGTFPPRPIDILGQMALNIGTEPPNVHEALHQLHRGGIVHPLVESVRDGIGDHRAWREGNFEQMSRDFRITYSQVLPAAVEKAATPEILASATRIRANLRANPNQPTPGGVLRPADMPEFLPLPAPPSFTGDDDEADEGDPNAAKAFFELHRYSLSLVPERTGEQWRTELALRRDEPDKFAERLAEHDRLVAAKADELRAKYKLFEDGPGTVKNSGVRMSRFVVHRSFFEIRDRAYGEVFVGAKNTTHMSFDSARDAAVAWIRDMDRDQTIIRPESTVSEQRMRAAKRTKYSDDADTELVPDGNAILRLTVVPDGMTPSRSGARTVPLPPVPLKLDTDDNRQF